MAIKIQIVAEDKATPVVNHALDNTKKKSSDAAGTIGNRFRDVFENISQNATGSFGSVAGGLFKLPGPAGIAIGAILGIVGALGAMALKSAQATAATNSDSAKFLATIEKLKSGIGSVVEFIGAAVIPVFNALADVFGVAATEQETLLAQSKAYHDSLIANVKGTDDFIAKIKEFLEATDRLTETTLINNYFKAFADGNTALATSIQQQITQLKILQAGRRVAAEESKGHAATEKKGVEDVGKAFEAAARARVGMAKQIAEQEIADHRERIRQGLELADRARERDLQELNDNNARRALVQQAHNERIAQLAQQLAAQQQIGAQIFQGIAQSLAAGVVEGEKLSGVLAGILKQLASRLLAQLLFRGLGAAFGGGFGAIGGLFGGFQHGGSFTVGGSPGIDQNLVAFRASRGERVTVTPQNQTTNTVTNNNAAPVNITLNLSGGNIDESFVRYKLIPILNREARLGTRVRSNS